MGIEIKAMLDKYGVPYCMFDGKKEGHDFCLGTLGNVMNACCGHGKNKGYIQFDNGITIRGYFEIERDR